MPRPLPNKPLIDKQTLDELNREAPPPPPPPAEQQAPAQPKPQPSQPIPPSSESQVEAPRPAAVPARPNFAMSSQNPADQLKQDMQNAMRNHGGQSYGDRAFGRIVDAPRRGHRRRSDSF